MGATMAISMGLQAGSELGGAIAESNALRAQGDYQKSQFDFNATVAGIQAEDAVKRGDTAAGRHRQQVRNMVGSQRAAAAAQGIDVNAGSVKDIQAETTEMGELDVLTIKNNAWRESWGFKVQAEDYKAQGKYAQLASRNAAQGTLLTGGLRALGSGLKAGYYLNSQGPGKVPASPDIYRRPSGRGYAD